MTAAGRRASFLEGFDPSARTAEVAELLAANPRMDALHRSLVPVAGPARRGAVVKGHGKDQRTLASNRDRFDTRWQVLTPNHDECMADTRKC